MDKTSKETDITIEFITPELAQEYLKLNDSCNKPLDEETVKTLIKKIKNGTWDPDGEAIYFDHGNILTNGQHRMTAIERSGIPVYVRVFRMFTE